MKPEDCVFVCQHQQVVLSKSYQKINCCSVTRGNKPSFEPPEYLLTPVLCVEQFRF